MSGLKQSGDLTAERLILLADILGHDWLNENLNKYKLFREQYSLESRWWHRLPEVSPIIPLVYSAKPGPRFLDEPFGVWQGDPSGILARLMAAIVEFQNNWEKLPDNLGLNSLRDKLYSSSRFFGFQHEISLATNLKGSGYDIEPCFFNPDVKKGSADIIVQDGQKTYDVQCKARNPSVATDMPYEVFLYLAGRWSRLVSDSGTSYALVLNLKQKIGTDEINQLLDMLKPVVLQKMQTPRKTETKYWDAEVFEVGYEKGQTPPENLKKVYPSEPLVPLYSDAELIKPGSMTSQPIAAMCHIFGHMQRKPEDYIFSTSESAAKSHTGDNPLIVSVNLYQELDVSEYLKGPRVANKYHSWSRTFFQKYPNVAALFFSANFEKYIEVKKNRFGLSKKYLVVESPNYDDVLLNLGIPD